MTDKIVEILEELAKDDSAMIIRPATTRDLALAQKELKEMGHNALPEGYVSFLHIVNGFAWNGILFYSTDQVTDPETEFTLDDIVSANEDFEERDISNCLLLGRSDMDLYVYDEKNNNYLALDLTSGDEMDDFETFEGMFVDIVGGRMEHTG